MLPARLSRLWNLIRRRSPIEHLESLRRRLCELEAIEHAASAELLRLRSRRGETPLVKKLSRRLKRLRRRTDRLHRAVELAQRLVK